MKKTREVNITKACRYSDWLWAERPRDRSSSPGRVKNFLLSMSSKPALGPIQHPYPMGSVGSFPGGKTAGT
jgi:hypothetical protein